LILSRGSRTVSHGQDGDHVSFELHGDQNAAICSTGHCTQILVTAWTEKIGAALWLVMVFSPFLFTGKGLSKGFHPIRYVFCSRLGQQPGRWCWPIISLNCFHDGRPPCSQRRSFLLIKLVKQTSVSLSCRESELFTLC
jgi:hypothetical protein